RVFPVSARLQKSKEGVAISGAPFFCLLFFGKTKKVSRPRQGVKQGMHHQQKNPKTKKRPPHLTPKIFHG
ncbi:hypothetical protein, partial [Ralstonia mannitolilytica]|uniref:hypothetical protein n=1 Tax=Ralstonia mannitolilytica TaxID=105219 RepID=UPI002931C856